MHVYFKMQHLHEITQSKVYSVYFCVLEKDKTLLMTLRN